METALITKASILALYFTLGCTGGADSSWKDAPLCDAHPTRKLDNYFIRSMTERHGLGANRNSPLYGFLGCHFGSSNPYHLHEMYIHLKTPYMGFPWVRYDVCPGYYQIARCDARLTFVSEVASSVPFRRIKALRDEFKVKFGAEFKEETETDTDYHALAMSDFEYRVELFVRARRKHAFGRSPVSYEIGFEVVNERCVPGVPMNAPYLSFINWSGVLRETRISEADAENDSAWVYGAGTGRTAEEILDDWVRNRDATELVVGMSRIGMGETIGTNSVVVCPEWESESFSTRLKAPIKNVDSKTATRLCDMLLHPDLFVGGNRTKTGEFTVGHIYGELIPGDRVTWFADTCRKIGTVCGEGEDGERWDCINRKMKCVSTLVYSTGGSVPPTEQERECMRKISDLRQKKRYVRSRVCSQLGHAIDFTTNGIASVTNILAECLSRQTPGFYVGVHVDRWRTERADTREVAQQIMEKRGRNRQNDYQYDLDRFRSDVLRLLKYEQITDDTARGFFLSRYELVKLRDWDRCENFENIVGRDEMFPETLVLRHRLFYEKPIGISDGEVPGIIEGVSGYSGRGLSDEEAERAALQLYEVLIRAFESSEDVYGRVLPVCAAVVSQNGDRLVMRMLFARIGVEFKGEARAETFLKQVCDEVDKHVTGFLDPNWKKELMRMREFDWSR